MRRFKVPMKVHHEMMTYSQTIITSAWVQWMTYLLCKVRNEKNVIIQMSQIHSMQWLQCMYNMKYPNNANECNSSLKLSQNCLISHDRCWNTPSRQQSVNEHYTFHTCSWCWLNTLYIYPELCSHWSVPLHQCAPW